jgi:hypothetical protein
MHARGPRVRKRPRATDEEIDMARYGAKAKEKVGAALHEEKRGKLRSGRSGKKVTSRKQAIAIGLSEARRAGGKVPDGPRASAGAKKKASKSARKSSARSKSGAKSRSSGRATASAGGRRRTGAKARAKKSSRSSAASQSRGRAGGRRTG